jgi:hypothetical protein
VRDLLAAAKLRAAAARSASRASTPARWPSPSPSATRAPGGPRRSVERTPALEVVRRRLILAAASETAEQRLELARAPR